MHASIYKYVVISQYLLVVTVKFAYTVKQRKEIIMLLFARTNINAGKQFVFSFVLFYTPAHYI